MADDLLASFMAMGTSDRGTLVQQFTAVVPGVDPDTAMFFLEANSWNLAAAVGSLMDQGPALVSYRQEVMPQGELVCDVTIGEGEEVPPGSTFTKTWRLRNSGPVPWPRDTVLVFTQGERMGAPEFVRVNQLESGEVADVSVQLSAPRDCGSYAASWRLRDGNNYFSDEIWVIITVAEGGMLSAVQGMHTTSIGVGGGAPPGFAVTQQQPVGLGEPTMTGAAGSSAAFSPGFGQPMVAGFGQPAATPMGEAGAAAPMGEAGQFGVPNFGSALPSSFGQAMGQTPATGTMAPPLTFGVGAPMFQVGEPTWKPTREPTNESGSMDSS